MSRPVVIGLSVVACLIALAILGAVALLNTGVVSLVSKLSSGGTEESMRHRQKAGYIGAIGPSGATGALIEAGLDPDTHRSPPNLMIPGGTKVKVLISHENGAQVIILSGDEKSKKVWIRWDDLD
jgi:hypothetical protein